MHATQSIISIVFIGGEVAFALSIMFLFFASLLHILNQRKENYQKSFYEKMRPYLMKAVFEDSVKLPNMSKKDRILFLDLWNRVHQTLKGPTKERLNQLAYQNKLDQLAWLLFQKKGFYEKVLAIWTFGHLKEKKVWKDLIHLLDHRDSYISLTAAQSLLRIDATLALPILISFFIRREDWPSTKVVMMLKENETVELNHSLSKFFSQVPTERIPLFLRYLEMMWSPALSPLVRKLLRLTSDPEIISTGLRLLRSPDDLPMIHNYLYHPSKAVRIQATKALGRIGGAEDVPALIALLSNEEWWIRYQAAKSLTHFTFIGMEKLKKIQEEQTDPVAKEILNFAIAEKEFA